MGVCTEYLIKEQLHDYQVLLFLAATDSSQDRADKATSLSSFPEGRQIDWGLVLCLAEKHRLSSVLYSKMKKSGLLPTLPENFQKSLYWKYMKIVGDNLKLRKKLLDILALFESRDIPAVPIKGPLLSHMLYGDSELRYFQDLDILVPKRRAVAARDALLASGFVLHESMSGKRFEQFLDFGRECDFFDPAGKVAVDLHWRLAVRFRRRYDYHFCKPRIKEIRFHDRTVNTLSPEDTLLHLCLHGNHDLWQSLEQILCVAQLIKRCPRLDWDVVQKLAEELHCKRALFLGLFLAADVFGAQTPSEIARSIEKDKVVKTVAHDIYYRLFQNTGQKGHMERRMAQIPYYLKIREHPLDKALYLLQRIFVPTSKDWKNRDLHSRLSFAYHLSRPLDLAAELAKTRKETK